MSEDYLWDGSGEADPELLYLEQTLGALRYDANNASVRPLPSAVIRLPRQKRRFFSTQVLAIAASVLLTLMAGGIYLMLAPAKINDPKSGTNTTTIAAVNRPPVPEYTDTPPSQSLGTLSGTDAGQTPHARQPVAYSVRAHKSTLSRRVRAQENEALAAAAERARGEEAKNKLMLALRIASLELRDVRRRVYTEDASFSSSQKK